MSHLNPKVSSMYFILAETKLVGFSAYLHSYILISSAVCGKQFVKLQVSSYL